MLGLTLSLPPPLTCLKIVSRHEVFHGADEPVSSLAAVSLDVATCRGPSWSAHTYLWDLN